MEVIVRLRAGTGRLSLTARIEDYATLQERACAVRHTEEREALVPAARGPVVAEVELRRLSRPRRPGAGGSPDRLGASLPPPNPPRAENGVVGTVAAAGIGERYAAMRSRGYAGYRAAHRTSRNPATGALPSDTFEKTRHRHGESTSHPMRQ